MDKNDKLEKWKTAVMMDESAAENNAHTVIELNENWIMYD